MTTRSPSGRSFFVTGEATACAVDFLAWTGLALVAVATDGPPEDPSCAFGSRPAAGPDSAVRDRPGRERCTLGNHLCGTVATVWYCLDYMSIDTRAAPPGRLTSTSYLVLGLIEREGPSTPYELKRHVAATIGHFWSFPHALLYNEPARLVELGLLTAEREADGRRRRLFTLTDRGRAAIRAGPATPPPGSGGCAARGPSGRARPLRGRPARRSGAQRLGLSGAQRRALARRDPAHGAPLRAGCCRVLGGRRRWRARRGRRRGQIAVGGRRRPPQLERG